MNLKNLLTTQYWFQVNSAFISPGEKLFLFAGAILILIAIALKISSVMAPAPVDKKYRGKFYNLFLTIGILELLWYVCRWQNALFFDTKFVAWLIVLVGVIWLISLLVKSFKNYPQEKMTWEKEMVRQKYLPN